MSTADTLTVTDAARQAGVSPSTIRRWMEAGDLKFSTSHQGWRVTTKDALMQHLSRQPHPSHRTVGGASAQQSHETHTTLSNGSHLEALKISLEALERERRINDELRTEISGIRSELLKMMSEMKALLQKEDKGLLSRWIRG
jgi:excisionase family DNA binding protein